MQILAFSYSNLSGINLAGTTLYRNNFHNSNLSGLDFTDINNKHLIGSIFVRADLSNSNFEGINFLDDTRYEISFYGKAHLMNEIGSGYSKLGYYNQAVNESGYPNKFVLDKVLMEMICC